MLICRMSKRLLALLVLSAIPLMSLSDPVKYSVTDRSWNPYWIVEPNEVSGILNDIMIELGQRLDISISANNQLPVRRAQYRFKGGDVHIECCVSETWRNSPDQAEVSLWTDEVMTVEEVLIFPPGQSFEFNQLEDLKGKLISTVMGYGYEGSEFFERSDSINNISQIQKVALARCDAGIIDRAELAYMLKHSQLLKEKKVTFEVGPVINRSALKMRIHRSRPELVAPINAAINEMKQDGTVQKIIDRYLK